MIEQAPELDHPKDHQPDFRFLRQVRHPHPDGDALIDVFYCARCLGFQEVQVPSEMAEGRVAPRRSASPLPALGSAARNP